jgi:hypothetical protein
VTTTGSPPVSPACGAGTTCWVGDCGALHAVATVMTNGFAKILRIERAAIRAA